MEPPLRIAFAAPVYAPAVDFGGPIGVMRELARGLVERGHAVDVYTSSVRTVRGRPVTRTSVAVVDGATVHYAATPLRYRWMGVTPTLPHVLRRAPRPDVAHVFGFRDPPGTIVAAWCRRRDVPYVFEGLGMVRPKLRKVLLKRALDATLFRHVLAGAALVIATSRVERDEYVGAGVDPSRVAIRPNGFPPVVADGAGGALRARLGLRDEPLVLSVGRIAAGKGLDLLVRAAPALHDAHFAIVGPDDGHGTTAQLERLRGDLGVDDRVHLLGPVAAAELPSYYADADVFALPSAHENFGMVAAEAAAAGTAIVVTDRSGISELLAHAAAVVPYDAVAIGDALAALLADPHRREGLGAAAREVARSWSWERVVGLQEDLYRRVVAG